MNTTCKNSVALLTFLLLLCSITASAKKFDYEKSKEFNQSFNVSLSDLLQVDNRFGNISISHWTKNEVEITVKIETKANNEKRAQADLDRIHISLSKSGSTISAITSMTESNSNNSNGNNQITINYYISMPAKLTTDLTQKYGNIKLPDNNPGKCSLHSKFGNINAGNFTGELSVESKYGNVDLGNVENATLDFGYVGKSVIKNAKRLTIDSKYSNIELGTLQELQLKNKYGNAKIQSVDKVTLDMKYSEANIGLVRKELNVDELSYGTLTVKELSANFSQVNVNARYGNLNVSLPAKAAFKVEAQGMKYGNFDIKGFNVTRSEKENKKNYYTEVNNGGQRTIRFGGNSFSNLIIKAL